MNINRHNYEEYFILYMDNELDSAERRMVENFVQTNPDLKDELDILLQSKLTPDNSIVFDSKEELMKTADDAAINLSNYEEWLTLYIDNELSLDQKNQVELFVASHPQIENEFFLLQKTKVQAEEIVFPYKESLYRRTEKVRVIQMRWWRVAAAAVLLLVLSTTVILVLNTKKQPGQSFASSNLSEQLRSTRENIAKTTPQNNNVSTESEKNKKEEKQNNSVTPNLVKNNNPIEKQSPEIRKDKKDEPVIAHNDNDKPSNDLPQEPLNNPNIKKNIDNYGSIATIESNSSSTNTRIDVTKHFSIPSDSGIAFVNNQEKNLEEGDNKSSRGFFRKAVRFIEKRTGIKPANDDDRVLIGSLAVKL